jgi:hypothetical protein
MGKLEDVWHELITTFAHQADVIRYIFFFSPVIGVAGHCPILRATDWPMPPFTRGHVLSCLMACALSRCSAHGTLSQTDAKQFMKRWKPDGVTYTQQIYSDHLTVRQYYRACLAMDIASYAFVGTQFGTTLYIVQLASNADCPEQHIVSAILWDSGSRDAKIECLRALKRWYTKRFASSWLLARATLEGEDEFAWRMALETSQFFET